MPHAASTARAQPEPQSPGKGQGQHLKELHCSSRMACAPVGALRCQATCRNKVQPRHWHQCWGSSNLSQPGATPWGDPAVLPCILRGQPVASDIGTGSGPKPGWPALGPSQPKAAVTWGAEQSCLHSCAQHGGASQPREGNVWKSTG